MLRFQKYEKLLPSPNILGVKLLNFPLILKLPNTGDQIHRKVGGAKDKVVIIILFLFKLCYERN